MKTVWKVCRWANGAVDEQRYKYLFDACGYYSSIDDYYMRTVSALVPTMLSIYYKRC